MRPTPTLIVSTMLSSALAAQVTATEQAKVELSLGRVLQGPGTLFEFLPERSVSSLGRGPDLLLELDPAQPELIKVLPLASEAQPTQLSLAKLRRGMRRAGLEPPARGLPKGLTFQESVGLRFETERGIYTWLPEPNQVSARLEAPAGASRCAFAPFPFDKHVAYVDNHQLFVLPKEGPPRRLSSDGSPEIVYGGAAHRAEFGIKDGLWWSPDGRFLAFSREDLGPTQAYPYADHSSMPPRALPGRYPMAGGANSHVQIGIFDTETGKTRYLAYGKEQDVYWTNVGFSVDGKKVYVALVNRDQDHMKLLRFASATAAFEKVLFEESDKEWVEPQHPPIALRDGGFLWFSPRDGFQHLYHYDAEGKLLGQLTKGRFDVASYVGTRDEETFYVMASGSNPLEMHLFSCGPGAEMLQLSKERGWHECRLADSGNYILDSWSNLDEPGHCQLIHLPSGKRSHKKSIGSPIATRGRQSFFSIAAADGTPLHGTLILPPQLDERATRKYPVLLYVYGGPHSQLVQDRWLGGASLWLQHMALRGFIICTLDGRGTNNRGIDFAQAVHRRLAELEVKDQLAAVDYLKTKPYVDPTRIGVHGWSYGGYMTLNLMLRAPKVFRAGAAGAPVTDWAQYETGYTERYMDTPAQNPEGYAKSSVLPLADQLAGRLLVIHGTDDKTVMWSHSLAFVDRCIEAMKLIDYMPYPMQKHGIGGRDRVHLYLTLTRFFEERLKGR